MKRHGIARSRTKRDKRNRRAQVELQESTTEKELERESQSLCPSVEEIAAGSSGLLTQSMEDLMGQDHGAPPAQQSSTDEGWRPFDDGPGFDGRGWGRDPTRDVL
ncbi:hypothetical protein KW796_01025 [Candidatus Parcubacteria bacterium]|nr:hypothetical protein [Candidatus Parcubacteria bacterium]